MENLFHKSKLAHSMRSLSLKPEDKKLIINEKIEFYRQAKANEDDKVASQILESLMNMLEKESK